MKVWRRLTEIRGNVKKLLVTNRITHPNKMGEKILLLATAPCVKEFFLNDDVKEKFHDYDIACINYMIYYSQEEIFRIKPKYFILFDSIFYDEKFFPNLGYNPEKEKIKSILKKINWNCYIVTSVLADFGIENSYVQYIRLSCFTSTYKKRLLPFYRKNLINMGIYNVIQGSIFYAITFGYKEIAILGCTYKNLNMYMEKDGLHIWEQIHYYDEVQIESILSNEDLLGRKTSYIADSYRRAAKSFDCCWSLKKYANIENAKIVNYSEGSLIDAFEIADLHELENNKK